MLTAPARFEDLEHSLATDYYFLREQLTDEQLDVLRRVRVFFDDEVLPVIGGYWERAEVPWPLIRRLGELGIVGEDIDAYGCPGLDPIASARVGVRSPREARFRCPDRRVRPERLTNVPKAGGHCS